MGEVIIQLILAIYGVGFDVNAESNKVFENTFMKIE